MGVASKTATLCVLAYACLLCVNAEFEATQLSHVEGTVVHFYKYHFHQGPSISFSVPPEGIECQNFVGRWNDEISSDSVDNEDASKPAVLKVFTDSNCQGSEIDSYWKYNDRASSFSYTTTSTIITFYRDYNFGGPRLTYQVPDGGAKCNNFRGFWDNQISSASVMGAPANKDAKLYFYTEPNCNGIQFTDFYRHNDQASSFSFAPPRTTLTFFRDFRNQGPSFNYIVPEGGVKCKDLPSKWNDEVSSVVVDNAAATPGAILTMYTDVKCGGVAFTDFYQYNDKASSYSYIAPKKCACPKLYAPVCGSDGETYPNSCLAKCLGLDFTKGKCSPCDPPCAEGTTCETSEDGGAQCELNCECTDVYAPVCARDGNTYPNACQAECRMLRYRYGACSSTKEATLNQIQ